MKIIICFLFLDSASTVAALRMLATPIATRRLSAEDMLNQNVQEDAPLFYLQIDEEFTQNRKSCMRNLNAKDDLESLNAGMLSSRGSVQAEYLLCQSARDNPRRTMDVHKADVILQCPFMQWLSLSNCLNESSLGRVENFRKSAITGQGYRAQKPHIFISGDIVSNLYDSQAPWFSVMGDASGRRDPGVAGNYVILPYMPHEDLMTTEVKRQVDSEPLTSPRKTLAFFRGSLGYGGERRKLDQAGLDRYEGIIWKPTDCNGYEGCYTRQDAVVPYVDSLLSSTFCLTPAGHECMTRRYYDAVAAGCIPIITNCETFEYPFDEAIDYSSFTLFYPSEDIRSDSAAFVSCLRNVSTTESFMAPLRLALRQARENLIYGWSDQGDKEWLWSWDLKQKGKVLEQLLLQNKHLPPLKRREDKANSLNLKTFCHQERK